MKTDDYSRAIAIEQAITEALAPINMAGVGAFSFLRRDHTDNGSTFLYDQATLVGRRLHCSIDWVDEGTDEVSGICEGC